MVGRAEQDIPQFVGDGRHKGIVEERAIKVTNPLDPKHASALHGVEQHLQRLMQIGKAPPLGAHNVGEDVVGEQVQIFGKQAKEQAHQEVG